MDPASVANEWISILEWRLEQGLDERSARRRIERCGIEVRNGLLNRSEANEKWAKLGNHKFSANRMGKGKVPKREPLPPVDPNAPRKRGRPRGTGTINLPGRPLPGSEPPADAEPSPQEGPAIAGPPKLKAINGGRPDEMSTAEIDRQRQLVKLHMDQLKLATAQGAVYPAAEVDAHISSMIVAAREVLWHLPRELADKVAATSDPVKVAQILEAGVNNALAKLGGYKPRKTK